MAQRTILWSPYQRTRTHVVLYVDCENKDGNVSYEHILCSMNGGATTHTVYTYGYIKIVPI